MFNVALVLASVQHVKFDLFVKFSIKTLSFILIIRYATTPIFLPVNIADKPR